MSSAVPLPNAIRTGVGLAQGVLLYSPDSHDTIAYQLQRHARAQPERPFLRYGDRSYTYGEANEAINRHAYAYKLMGVKKGAVVALLMENRPEYIFHMLALHKLGAVSALINHHASGDALVHALEVSGAERIVVGSELWKGFHEVHEALGPLGERVDIDIDREHPSVVHRVPRFQDRLVNAVADDPPEAGKHRLEDPAALIFTSGTTGLPKAARILHHRMYRAGRIWWTLAMRYKQGDVLYTCLPLYHSNGSLLALSSVVSAGVTMALARGFSRRAFWEDCRKHGATGFIYIGEICRYLMNVAPTEHDRDHSVQVITGNGMPPDLWRGFQKRFGIRRVAEFYGATEGNCITVNFSGAVGSVGPMLPGMALARWDHAAGDFVRDDQGFLQRASRGEPGVLLGRISPRLDFDGYTDEAATGKKIIRDAFEPGDAYFDTGDLLRVDWLRNLYFVDRLGDTFRWKGENVSTQEVQAQIAKWEQVAQVNVYGVKVPGTDGRAGMAAIRLVEGADFDAEGFRAHVEATLPGYAQPIFVRIQRELDTTSTHKLKKTQLQQEGYDPSVADAPVYFRRPDMDAYVPIDAQLLEEIEDGFYPL